MKRFFIRLAGSCLSGIGCVTNALGFFETYTDTTKTSNQHAMQYTERKVGTPIVFRINYSALFDDIGTACDSGEIPYPATGSNGGAHTYSNLGNVPDGRNCICQDRTVYCKPLRNETGTLSSYEISTGSEPSYYYQYDFTGVTPCTKMSESACTTGSQNAGCCYTVLPAGTGYLYGLDGCLSGAYLTSSATGVYGNWYSSMAYFTGSCFWCPGYRGDRSVSSGFGTGSDGSFIKPGDVFYNLYTYANADATGSGSISNNSLDADIPFQWYANGTNVLNVPGNPTGITTCKAYNMGVSSYTDYKGGFTIETPECPYVSDGVIIPPSGSGVIPPSGSGVIIPPSGSGVIPTTGA